MEKDRGRLEKVLCRCAEVLGDSAAELGTSAEVVGRQQKDLVESDEVLIQTADDLLQSAHVLFQSAEDLGEKKKVLVRCVAVLGRQDAGLRRLETVRGRFAEARGRQPEDLVESDEVLIQSADDLGKSAQDRGRQKKEGGKKTESVFRPSTCKEVRLTAIKSVHRSLAILKLPKVVAQIITFAQNVLTAMTNNPKFPSPSPALTLLSAAITALGLAEATALTRAKGAATTRNDKKAALVALMQQLRTYVQTVADADPENSANIIQSAGFAVKKTTVHKPRTFEVVQGAVSGTAKVVCPSAGHRASYDWEYSADGGKTWVGLPSSLQAKTSITGLAQGSTVQVRYRAVTKAGVGDWSQPTSLFIK